MTVPANNSPAFRSARSLIAAAEVDAIREAAKERMKRKPVGESALQTFEEQKPNDRLTDAARAKLAGTNRQYINDADKLAEKAPDLLL